MQKTKLGISVALLGLIVVMGIYFGGLTAGVILVGYVLMFEENEWLKKTAVKAICLSVVVSLVISILNLIPGLISWVSSVLGLIGLSFSYSWISRLVNVITDALSIIRTVLFLLMGVKAFNQGVVKIPVIDDIVNKNM